MDSGLASLDSFIASEAFGCVYMVVKLLYPGDGQQREASNPFSVMYRLAIASVPCNHLANVSVPCNHAVQFEQTLEAQLLSDVEGKFQR